jgi:uncharacterized protein (TIGR00369 family)
MSDLETRVRENFTRQAVMKTLGANVLHVALGEVDIEMPYNPAFTQQHGYTQAGIVAALADSAAGYAAFTYMDEGAGVVSVEFKINLLAPAVGEMLIARGRVKRAGKSITVSTADVFVVQDGTEKLVATLQGTMMAVYGRDERA